MKKIFTICLFAPLLIFCFLAAANQNKIISVALPDKKPVFLKPSGYIAFAAIDESSGLVKSHKYEGVFWTHNDSGDKARIFAINRAGNLIQPDDSSKIYQGIRITAARNKDWEDIAIDDSGNLILADCGNNDNDRRDLCLYFVKEPNPYKVSKARAFQRVEFRHTDQKAFPPPQKNFDAEAIFWAHGKLYLLTKHRSDLNTKLYRFDSLNPRKINPISPIGTFNIGGMVTAADASPDGSKLVVLTYSAIWLFEIKSGSDDYFSGKISWLPIFAKQCEGVCLDGNKIIICNEQRDLFEVRISDLQVVKDF